jgi:hypothetical protein
VAAIVVAAAAGQTADAQPSARRHDGQILNVANGQGMEAQATAFSPQATREGGGMPGDPCPVYRDPNPPFVTRSVRPTGTFRFEVDAKFHTYRSQYCAGGFTPESRADNPNDPGVPVAGNPISMTPRR